MPKSRFYFLLPALLLNVYSAHAVEPPFIVDQTAPEFSKEEKPRVDIPEQESLSTSKVDTVHVSQVQFQGGTVFELTELIDMAKPLIDRDVSKADMVKVLREITARYKAAGYALSFAYLPKQDTTDGELTIVLVEGYVAAQDIDIKDEDVKKRVQKLAAKMQDEKPLKQATFERYVSLIENTPGYKFKIRVPKPKQVSGATTIHVEEAKAETIQTSLGFDDSQEEELRLLAGATINSLTSHADRLSLQTLIPTDTIDAYYAVNYRQDIGSDGLQLEVSGNHFESQGDDRIFVADVPINYEENKDRDRVSAGLRYPIVLSRSSSWYVGGNLSYLDEDATYQLRRSDGSGQAVDIDKKLRYSSLELNTQWYQKSAKQVWQLAASVKQGLEVFGSQENEIRDANGTRSGAETTYFNAVTLDGTWRYLLSPRWRVQTKANVFWSDDILPSAEQVRYGGPRFGRGYPDGQAQGDEGTAGEIELRYLQPIPNRIVKRLEPYIVMDAARSKLRSSDTEQELASAAVGVDITDGQTYNLGLEYAKPMGDPHYETGDRSPIYNIRIRWQF